jgi:hypothetical protein
MPMNSRKLILLTIIFCLSSFAALTNGLDTWQVRNPQPTLRALRAVAYGNDTFVAVGEEAAALIMQEGAGRGRVGRGCAGGVCHGSAGVVTRSSLVLLISYRHQGAREEASRFR